MSVYNDDGTAGQVFVDFCIDRNYKRDAKIKTNDVNYLAYRAWCFQESMLSHRLLTFDRLQMSFTCLRHGLFEDREIIPAMAREYRNDFLPSFRGPLSEDSNILQSALNSWYNVLSDYTNRNLTFSSDKLVAVSGIANVVGSFLRDEYFAGIWRKSLPQGLLWSPYDEEDLPNPSYEATRSSEYRAPSWSWASIDSRISSFLCRATPLQPTFATVLDISTKLSGPDPYGQVKSGRFTVRGPLKKASCGYPLDEWPQQPWLCWDSLWTEDISHCIFDDETPTVGSPLWCLKITSKHGLILVPRHGTLTVENEFVRIGIFHLRLRHVDNKMALDRFSDNDITTIHIF